MWFGSPEQAMLQSDSGVEVAPLLTMSETSPQSVLEISSYIYWVCNRTMFLPTVHYYLISYLR